MKLTLILMLQAILLASLALAADKGQPKLVDNYIAVFDLDVEGADKSISRPLTDSIRRELFKSGKYELIDRGNMVKILGEQKFQDSTCISGECVVEAGQLLGVGKIITGSVSKMGRTYYLSLQLVNVGTGKIENVSEDKCKCEVDNLIGASKRLVKKLLGLKVDEPEIVINTEPSSVDRQLWKNSGLSAKTLVVLDFSMDKGAFENLDGENAVALKSRMLETVTVQLVAELESMKIFRKVTRNITDAEDNIVLKATFKSLNPGKLPLRMFPIIGPVFGAGKSSVVVSGILVDSATDKVISSFESKSTSRSWNDAEGILVKISAEVAENVANKIKNILE